MSWKGLILSAIKQPIPVLLSAIKETLLLGSATLFVDFLIGLMLLLKGSWSHCVAEAGGGPAAFAGSVKNGPVVDQNVCNRARCCSTAEKRRIEVDTKGLIQMRALRFPNTSGFSRLHVCIVLARQTDRERAQTKVGPV